MKNIEDMTEKTAQTTFLIGVLTFCAYLLALWKFPEKAESVICLCGMCFCIIFGWTIGLLAAKKNATLKENESNDWRRIRNH